MNAWNELVERCAHRRNEKIGPLSDEAYAELVLAVRQNPADFADETSEQALLVLARALDAWRASRERDDLLTDKDYEAEHARRLAALRAECERAVSIDPGCLDAHVTALLASELDPDPLLSELEKYDGAVIDDGTKDTRIAELEQENSRLKYQSAEFDRNALLDPLYGTASLSLRTEDKAWSITEYVDYEYAHGSSRNYFNALRTTLAIPYFDISLEWAGPADRITFSSIEANLDVDSVAFQLWRGRIYFSFGIESSFEMDMENPYAASFSITPSITFSIAEFLDFTFSFTSVNNGFYNYIDDNGSFSLGMMFEDLLRSFDFFGGGRYNTSFVLDEAALEITHYMKDWNFNFRYSTEIVLSDDVYQFRPKVSVYMSWKTIPDLNIDQQWEQRNGRWISN